MMRLKVMLPYQTLLELDDVYSLVAAGPNGFFGILPHRLDCVCPLIPGVITLHSQQRGALHIAIGEGFLTKVGMETVILVREAIVEEDLTNLKFAIREKSLLRQRDEALLRESLESLEEGIRG